MMRGEKVVLRPLDLSDAQRLTAWLNDDEVTEFLTFWLPVTTKGEEEWIRSAPPGEARFAIDTFDGRHIGQCALHEHGGHARCSGLGVFIGDKDFWGKGFGTDALITLCAFGFAYRNLHRIELTVHADNPRAIRCYQKAGFQVEGTLREHRYHRGRYHDVVYMGLLCREFRERFPERWPE